LVLYYKNKGLRDMLVEQTLSQSREVNHKGRYHLKIINIGDKLNSNGNSYLRVTCVSSDDRLFVFPIYTHDNGMELIQQLARCIGDECIDNDEVINTSRFVGGFFRAIIDEYKGDNTAYESKYYVKQVWASYRRYDRTQSPTFKRVNQSNRGYSTFEE
jgi:hypothetical protein